jgi:cell division transport system permease protein
LSLFQALIYFSSEALSNLVRSWKVSLLAIMTIAVSLFLGGAFLLASTNLRATVDQWRAESRVVVYLVPESSEEERQRLHELASSAPELEEIRRVEPEEAASRFRSSFPSLADLLEGWGGDPLPASLELVLDWEAVDRAELDAWTRQLAEEPEVAMIDDDRDWLQQLDAVILMLEGLAAIIGLGLLITAVFTISSVIRLTAYLYQDEIAVMRMVGATEFFIRGPFYFEGLFQGLCGGTLATLFLAAGHRLLNDPGEGATLLISLVAKSFLTPAQLAMLVLIGGAAGLVGAIASLRRESLGQTAEPDNWARG